MVDKHIVEETEGDDATHIETRRIVKEEVAKALETPMPTYLEGMQASLRDYISAEFVTLRAEIGRTVDNLGPTTKKVTYKEFIACKPSVFKGEVDPLLSQRWISDMESTFETSHCDPNDAVIFVGNQLKERAKDWWELLQEFLHLRQKDEIIDTITAIFYDKAKFCPDLLQTEKMWINRYYSMLNAKYREFLTPSKCETLSELTDCARERELELKRQEERGGKAQV
ncbi:hypothetical protein E3N88_34694 [Mikania micrantha]|uniref:Retrotransposon gag domain-containing protein n=1 Tax=Mikania micrantha TaxID=192012 RepID=A0A5N6LYW4_9ASTR|nr:hypothetical protein E3N88_34694 [Mikania micrantha]